MRLALIFILTMVCCLTHSTGAPIASWLFDEDTGGLTRGEGPAGCDGNVVGARFVKGAGGQGLALSFSGDGDRVQFPPAREYAFDGTRSFSVSLWLRLPRGTSSGTVLTAADGEGNSVYRLCLGPGAGQVSFSLWGEDLPLIGQTAVDDGDWHYIAVAYDATSRRVHLFVDDQVQDQAQVRGREAGSVRLILGAAPDGREAFRGEIDDVVIADGIMEDLATVIRIHDGWTFLDPEQVRSARELYWKRYEGAEPVGRNLRQSYGALLLGEMADRDELSHRLSELRRDVRAVTGEDSIDHTPEISMVGETLEIEGYKVNRYVLTTECDVPVPMVMVFDDPPADAARRPAVLAAASAGKANILSIYWRWVTELVDRGVLVCLIDCRGVGELAQDWSPPGRSETTGAAHDMVCVADYLRTRSDVHPGKVMCVGFGPVGASAVLAGVLDPELARVAAVAMDLDPDPEATQARMASELPLDLPVLAGALLPRGLWVQGVSRPDPFAWTAEAYRRGEARMNFLMTSQRVQPVDLVTWLTAGWQEDDGDAGGNQD